MKNSYFFLLFILGLSPVFSQNIHILATEGQYLFDENLDLIVCNKNILEYDDLTNINSLNLLLDDTEFTFLTIPSELQFGVQYTVFSGIKEYLLYFSNLPLINITTELNIEDDQKSLAHFVFSDTTSIEAISSFCGIEFRGGFSLGYPKKSYSFELWEDETGDDTRKVSLANMRNDDDWILIAMYNEPLRSRTVSNHQLWRNIHTPYYINEQEDAMAGIRTQYVELAINNEYMGIYALGEKIDKKQLKLQAFESVAKGELYKGIGWGASTFSASPPFNNNERVWAGFELKYPKENELTDWTNIHAFVDFVIHSNDEDFKNNIEQKFHLNNASDYFIFLNLLRATDNTGKNIYMAKYDENEPYFYVPWDLDGSYGMIYDGSQENITDDILSNGFYNRLLNADLDLFKQNTSLRWQELREEGVLSTDHLVNNLTVNYNLLSSNLNYEREALKWGESSIDLTNLAYTIEWLENRLAFLDIYFGTIILDTKEVVSHRGSIELYPNPVRSILYINTELAIKSCELYTAQGKQIILNFPENESEIDLSYLPLGIYILKIKTQKSEDVRSFKLIKE